VASLGEELILSVVVVVVVGGVVASDLVEIILEFVIVVVVIVVVVDMSFVFKVLDEEAEDVDTIALLLVVVEEGHCIDDVVRKPLQSCSPGMIHESVSVAESGVHQPQLPPDTDLQSEQDLKLPQFRVGVGDGNGAGHSRISWITGVGHCCFGIVQSCRALHQMQDASPTMQSRQALASEQDGFDGGASVDTFVVVVTVVVVVVVLGQEATTTPLNAHAPADTAQYNSIVVPVFWHHAQPAFRHSSHGKVESQFA
jgi:hypothetical protein